MTVVLISHSSLEWLITPEVQILGLQGAGQRPSTSAGIIQL